MLAGFNLLFPENNFDMFDFLISSINTEEEKCKYLELYIQKFPDEKYKTYQHGKNALHIASELGLISVAQLLLNLQWPLNAQDDYRNAALHYAAINSISKPVMLLILSSQSNVKVNITNLNGNTALHEAASIYSAEGIKILVKHPQCNLTIKNVNNQTPKEIIEQLLPSSKRDILLQSFNTSTMTKALLKEHYSEVFVTQEPTIDKKQLKSLTKQFSKLNLNFSESHDSSITYHSSSYAMPYPLSKAEKLYRDSNLKLLESDFIFGKMHKLKYYLDSKRDPNLLILSISISPSIKMPLIFYAFIHKQEKMLIEIIKNNGFFSPDSLTRIFKILYAMEDDSYPHFIDQAKKSLFPQYLKKCSKSIKLIKKAETRFNRRILEHGLAKYKSEFHLFPLEESFLYALFPTDLKMNNGVIFIYSICCGEHPSEIRQFDPNYIRQCILGLLDQYEPDTILEIMSKLIPHLNNIQRLIGLYLIKELVIYNLEFGYDFTLDMEEDLSHLLSAHYDSLLCEDILNLYQLTNSLRNNSIYQNYHILDYLNLCYPSLRKKSIHYYIDNILSQKEINFDMSAIYLANEFRFTILQPLRHSDLKEFRRKDWESSNSNRMTNSPHIIKYESRVEAISNFVFLKIKKQNSDRNRAALFSLFVHTMHKCLTDCKVIDADFNSAIAILGGLLKVTTKEFDKMIHSKTHKMFEQLQQLLSPIDNFKYQRNFIMCSPSVLLNTSIYFHDKIMIQENESTDYALVGKLNLSLLNTKRKYSQYHQQGDSDLSFQLHTLSLTPDFLSENHEKFFLTVFNFNTVRGCSPKEHPTTHDIFETENRSQNTSSFSTLRNTSSTHSPRCNDMEISPRFLTSNNTSSFSSPRNTSSISSPRSNDMEISPRFLISTIDNESELERESQRQPSIIPSFLNYSGNGTITTVSALHGTGELSNDDLQLNNTETSTQIDAQSSNLSGHSKDKKSKRGK